MTATLDCILGRAGTGKTETCLAAMARRLQEDPMGPPLILLVPEHMTFKMERALAERVGRGHGFFRAYVFGFRRFARHVLLETGELTVPRISEVGRRLLLRKILVHHQKEKDLTVFARSVRQRGFTQSLSEAIQEFKSYRLDTDTLRETAAQLAAVNGRLAGKLEEMSILTDEFDAAMAGKANDAEDMMAKLASCLPQALFMQGAEVWLDGFIFFNPQEREVVKSLLMSAGNVHITLPMSGRCEGERVRLDLPDNTREAGLFQRSYRTYLDLCKLAREELGIARVPVRLLDSPGAMQQTACSALWNANCSGRRRWPGLCPKEQMLRSVSCRLPTAAWKLRMQRLISCAWCARRAGVTGISVSSCAMLTLMTISSVSSLPITGSRSTRTRSARVSIILWPSSCVPLWKS